MPLSIGSPTYFTGFSRCHRQAARCVRYISLLLLMPPAPAQPAADPVIIPVSTAVESSEQWSEPLDLLEEDLNVNWKHFSSVEQTTLDDVWVRTAATNDEDAQLVCLGDPKGFLYTEKEYGEFDLTFEWQIVSDPNGNSGVLVFTQDDPRLWPTSIQIQLHQPAAGSVFPSGDAITDATVKREGLARPVGEWNECRITSHSGRILVHVNGAKAGEVTGCKPAAGRIAIQSEGSEVRFRRIHLRQPEPKRVSDTEDPKSKDGDVKPNDDDSSTAG